MSNINSNEKKIKYITDLIHPDIIKSWHSGDVIIISAPCGRGKSFFIKNTLYDFAKANGKKILMLLHRTNCITQFQKEIEKDNKTDFIDICSYQRIEKAALYKKPFDWTPYQFIVSDEFHYFLDDAAFNITTDISLHEIMQQTNAIKIFTSATGENVQEYIQEFYKVNFTKYELKSDYSFIKSLTYFNKRDTIEEFIKEAIEKKQKSIFFIQSAKLAFMLYKKYSNDCLFCCSTSNDYYKSADKHAISMMLEKQQFDKLILITTCALDAGVNIIDKDLHNIVIDVKDTHSLIQCLGRKRIQDNNDYVNLYIKAINNMALGGMETNIKHQLEMANYLRNHTTEEFLDKYPRKYDRSQIIYDFKTPQGIVKKINPLMYRKKNNDLKQIQEMKELGEFGYCKYLFRYFKVERYRLINEDYSIKRYLESHLGQVMYQVKDRKELIEVMNVRSNGKLMKNREVLNSTLQELEFDFYIYQFKASKVINGKQKKFNAAWEIKSTKEDIEYLQTG